MGLWKSFLFQQVEPPQKASYQIEFFWVTKEPLYFKPHANPISHIPPFSRNGKPCIFGGNIWKEKKWNQNEQKSH